jgi:hypothetical protein
MLLDSTLFCFKKLKQNSLFIGGLGWKENSHKQLYSISQTDQLIFGGLNIVYVP